VGVGGDGGGDGGEGGMGGEGGVSGGEDGKGGMLIAITGSHCGGQVRPLTDLVVTTSAKLLEVLKSATAKR